MAGDRTKIIKFISVDNGAISLVDTTGKVQQRYDNIKNAIVYDHSNHVLYFVDSENDNGEAQLINGGLAYPIKVKNGDNVTIIDGSTDYTLDLSSIHPEYDIEDNDLQPNYNNGVLTCPFIHIDEFGHIIAVQRLTYTLTGGGDNALTTVQQVRNMIASHSSSFVMHVIGKGTELGYNLPDNPSVGDSYKAVDASTYYYNDNGVQKSIVIEYPGDVMICENTDPIKWNVIQSVNTDVFTVDMQGLVPAPGSVDNKILFDSGWSTLLSDKGIAIEDNKKIVHTNNIAAGNTINPISTEELVVPHSVQSADSSIYSFYIPKINYDAQGHITSVGSSKISLQVAVLKDSDFPTLTIRFKNTANGNQSIEFNPADTDKTIDLSDLSVTYSEDSGKIGGKTVSNTINDFTSNFKDSVIPTSGLVATFVENYVTSSVDASLNASSTKALQNKTIYAELAKKVDRSDVLSKSNFTEYTPQNPYNPATKKYADDMFNQLFNNKQDKLYAGEGVTIDASGVITFDINLFKVVDSSIAPGTIASYKTAMQTLVPSPIDDRIYVLRLNDPTSEEGVYLEMSWDVTNNTWVYLGQFTCGIMIEERIKAIEQSINDIKNMFVFLTEDEYEAIAVKDPEKVYFIYEDE